MARLRYNGLTATLGASLTSSATSVTFGAALTHSGGTAVPTLTGTDYIPLAILDSTGHLSEVVWLTASTAAATTGTIARAKEGTTGVSHASGDKVVCSPLTADGPWTNTLSLPLSTLTGWTAGSGTWAISTSVIRQSNTASGVSYRLRYTGARLHATEMFAEMDVKMDTASTVNARAGFLFNFPFASDTTGSILIAFRSPTGGPMNEIYAEYEGLTAGPAITLPSTVALGTWATLRCHKVGSDVTVWVNGTLVGTIHINQPANVDASTIALYSSSCDSSYRNLNVWTPTQP